MIKPTKKVPPLSYWLNTEYFANNRRVSDDRV